ncbi:MAG: hypothetical protein C0424_06380 [Sphingobacteriaceae bacterium]|nr:hypothetical protein [Sphingobacteriaceae bacterium]
MRWLGVFIAYWLGFLSSSIHAQTHTFTVNTGFKKSRFPAFFQSIEDSSFSLSSIQVAHLFDDNKTIKAKNRANFGYSRAAFWLGTQLFNNSHTLQQLTISLENPNIDSVEFWLNRGYGYELMGMAGDHLPQKNWIEGSRQPSFTFVMQPHQKIGLLIRARNSYSGNMILPFRLWDANHFDLYQQGYHLAWGLYFGFLLINIALAFSAVLMLRNSLYVWYALFLLSSLAYTFISFGFSYQYFTGSWPGSNDQFRTTAVILLSLFMMRFSQLFLRFKVHFKKLNQLLSVIMLVQISLVISSLFVLDFLRSNFNYIFPWFLGLMLTGYIILFIGSFGLLRLEPLRARAFILAYGLSLIGGGILILTDLNVLPYTMLTVHAAWFGNSIEIVIFTGILFYELKLMGDQKLKLEQIIAEEQNQRMKEFFRGQEKERERIARDLHDHVAGTLVGARFLLPNPSRLANLLDERSLTGYKRALQTLDNSIKDVRNLSHDLQPPSLNGKSLKYELQRLVSDYRSIQPLVEYQLHYELEEFMINDDTAVALYRICQECLQNAFKHAEALYVRVELFNQQSRVFLRISDNGKGFNPQTKTSGIGIQNIQARLAFTKNLKSTLQTKLGEGTSIQLSFDCA